MVTSSKILTVTYGTFSCTLEGFDDPFTTLQRVAEYFRKLAAEDRYFGGIPQVPDADTLKQIAEDSAHTEVAAEMAETGIILRQADSQDESSPEADIQPAEAETSDSVAALDTASEIDQDPTPETAPDPNPTQETAFFHRRRAAKTPEPVVKTAAVSDLADAAPEPETQQQEANAEVADAELVDGNTDVDGDAVTDDNTVTEDETAIAAPKQEPLILRRPARDDSLAKNVEETLAAIRQNVKRAETEIAANDETPIKAEPAETTASEPTHKTEAASPIPERTRDAVVSTLAKAVAAAAADQSRPVETEPSTTDDADAQPIHDDAGSTEVETAEVDDANNDSAESDASSTHNVEIAERETSAEDVASEPGSSETDTSGIEAPEITAPMSSAPIGAASTDTVDAGEADDSENLAANVQDREERERDEADDQTAVAEVALEDSEDLQDESAETETSEQDAAPEDRFAIDEAEEDSALPTETEPAIEDEDTFTTTAEIDAPVLEDTSADDTPTEAVFADEFATDEGNTDTIPSAQSDQAVDDESGSEQPSLDEDESDGIAEDVSTAAELDGETETESSLTGAQSPVADNPIPPNSSLTAEQEAELARDLEEAREAGEDEDSIDTAAEERRQQRRARVAALRNGDHSAKGDGALDRLLVTAQSKMDKPEQARRLNALDQLKAAVAATEARNQKPRDTLGEDRDESASETTDLAAYRDDLRRAQNNARRGALNGNAKAATPQPAPLILVSEQRIDEAPTEAQPQDPEAPAREVAQTDGNLALKQQPDASDAFDDDAGEIQGIPADAFTESSSFGDFAERIGAFELQDLLEAAAAYTSIIEGKSRFSRAQVMSKIAKLDSNEVFSKEAGLRSFGRLLREGKILRVQDGQFAISKASRFSIAARFDD